VYANPDIYMLDDTLSAVDAHVGKHLFDKCIKKEMKDKGKTVLFATNQLHVLENVDRIVVVMGGKISEIGTYNELMNDKGEFQKLMDEFNTKNGAESKPDKQGLMRTRSSSIGGDSVSEKEEIDMTEEGRLIEKEGIEKGGVDSKVFELYFVKAVGSYMVIVLLIALSVAAQGTQNAHEVMSSVWSTEYELTGRGDKFEEYFALWGGLGVLALVVSLVRARAWAWQAIQASLNLHDRLLVNVIGSKMEFFDTTPMGRILNRFTKDFYMVDLELPRNVSNFIVCLMSVIGAFVTIGAVLPWFFIVLGPILWYYYKVQSWYRPLSRDVQRVESASRSPIFASFSEAVSGVMTVRAFGMEEELQRKCDYYIDSGNNAYYLMHSSNRWLQVRLDALAGFTMSFVCVFVVIGREHPDSITVDAGTAGLMITFVQMVTGLMNWTVRMGCETEARITSVERIVEYSEMDTLEAAPVVDSYRPPKEWPTVGEVRFSNMSMRYKAGDPLILKDINLLIPGGSKVGVAGRTGSGKSSLLVSLFRMAEPTSDSVIEIDGYNCLKGGLKDVRGAISIIPQDPVMFNGTVKSNVDPTDQYSEEEIMTALRNAELGEAVSTLADVVDDGGTNYSVGQRQLFCLARALLRKTKVLVLDEATANVDVQTDEKIQGTLRREFESCTVITIAHRLNTISDSDYILVMDDGRVGEFDNPRALEKDEDSMWSKLLKSERQK
jgi:ATP-binding cassette, subfamily C (CFTR/MRP), member 1